MESSSSSWSNATYCKVRSLYNLLREFDDQSQTPIAFHKLNAQFLDNFIAFCQEKAYQYSTIYKTVNNLVWFLNWDELMRLKEYATDNRRMERVRDLFCFMCFAGVRFSDLQRLQKEDLKEGEIVVRRRGGGARIIPMNEHALQIRQKYENKYYLNNTAFPSMSIITMNKYLRLIGKDIGLSRMIYSARPGEEGLPLYSCLTAGIAVNTFIKNAIEMDIPVEIISRFTGVQNDSRVLRFKSDLAIEEMRKFNL